MATTYGNPEYGNRPYGGRSELLGLNNVVGAIVEVYDNTYAYKGVYQTGVGNFLGLEFTLDDSGCRNFTLFFAGYQDIIKKDIIKIKLFDSLDYFFTGVVRREPIDGSTKQEYNYSGYGLNDYLIRANTESLSYSSKTINYIVNDLVDNVVVTKTPIIKNVTKIDSLSTVITSINFKYVSLLQAFEQLKAIAQSDGNEYKVGVDETGEFQFKARRTDIITTLTVGKKGRYGIDNYEPEDTLEERSKYYVLNKDGTLITTVSTSENIDLYEDKITAPDIADADVPNWANGILLQTERVTRSANIELQIERNDPLFLVSDGNIRILSNKLDISPESTTPNPYGSGTYGSGIYGGGQYSGRDSDDTLQIKEVAYVVNNNIASRSIQLGSIPPMLNEDIIKVNKNIEALRVSIGR